MGWFVKILSYIAPCVQAGKKEDGTDTLIITTNAKCCNKKKITINVNHDKINDIIEKIKDLVDVETVTV